jgi:hypothetical protein
VATDADGDTSPTLVCDHRENVWVWYHRADLSAQAYLTSNSGDSWSLWVTLDGPAVYPRAALQAHRMVLAYFDGIEGSARFFLDESADCGLTWSHCYAPVSPTTPQLVSLRVDRRNVLHLVTEEPDGFICHRYSLNDAQFSPQTNAALPGVRPSLAIGPSCALLAYFDPSTELLRVARWDPSYRDLDPAGILSAPASVVYPEAWLGTLIDRRENLWLSGSLADDGPLTSIYSAQGDFWHLPS